MDNNLRYTDRLAKYVLIAAGICLLGILCWIFRSIIGYILIAVVVSLITKPVMNLMKKPVFRGKSIPNWLASALSLLIVMSIILVLIFLIIPLVSNIVKDVSMANIEQAAKSIAAPLSDLNTFLRESFPELGSDFRLEVAIGQQMQKLFNVSAFSSLIGSAASAITGLAIGLFSVVFIGFFFIKDDGLFTKIVCALVPDRYEQTAEKAIDDIEHLLSRYFIGVSIEVFGVTLINFIGLWFIARLGINAAIGIAFMTGIFNIIPYVGPLLGGALGTVLGLTIKYSSATPIGLDISFIAFTAVLIAIFCFTQLIDNFLYQPLIYSTSIKSKPLEIFIVLLIVGNLGGPLAMIVAIPIYTVFRVIAFRFFGHKKAIKRLIPSERLISEN
ncbi:MAG: AI-2E family transporter [Bacteroidales bacterium]|nr:AI-2E family transporter [Bacteroidales bacterium]